MTQVVKSSIQYHNQQQLEYFGQKVKNTMIPVKSNYVMKHIDRFLQFSNLDRSHNILEVGCGMGKFTFPLIEKGYQITGLDLSPFLLQKLLEYNDNRFNIPLISSDILEIPDQYNEQFDRVIGFFVLHHFHHLETYFQAMARVLKPGGEIIFVEPNANNILYYFQIFFTPGMSWKGDKGVFDMKKSVFLRAAHYAGLKLDKLKRYGFFPPFVVNTTAGLKVDNFLEKQSILQPVLPFNFIRLIKE